MASQESSGTNEADVMKDIAEPRETDVLCGRGGAALRHAGNQTYRRLVNLNKGLYITCLKTEKLKISRSIVAAIREQKGRFLERDAKKGVWFDIGDKKAVEKTSQALREGQPKLKKKMAALGQLPAEQANGGIESVPTSMQQQMLKQYGNGIYNARSGQSSANNSLNGSMHGIMNLPMASGMSINSIGRLGSVGSGSHIGSMGSASRMGSIGSGSSISNILDSIQMGRNNTGQLRNSMAQMPPPPLRTLSDGTSMNSISMNSMGGNNDLTILQHLRLDAPQSIPSWTPTIGSMESLMTMSTTDVPQMFSNRPSRQYNRNPSYGSHNNNNSSSNNNNINNATMQSITSNSSCSNNSSNNNNLSGFANRNSVPEPNFLCEKIGSFDPTEQPLRQQQQQQQQQFARARDYTQSGFNDNNYNNMNDQRPTGPSVNDRRRYFAKMKLGREANARNMPSMSNDGMPDIHMVDSQFSLLSNLSAHGSKHSRHRGQNAIDMDISKHGLVKKDSIGSEYIGVGSRRSLMSGLSKLSGHSSDINNTFTNMAKKITSTNHTISSRSLTMSEFSGVDEEFAEDDFNFDIPEQRNS